MVLEGQRDELAKCSRCGFCQAFCPAYSVTGVETQTARGRNSLLLGVAEGRLTIGEIRGSLLSCLLCGGCRPNCFSEVKTNELVIKGREALIEQEGGGIKGVVFRTLLPSPGRLALSIKFARLLRRAGFLRLATVLGLKNADVVSHALSLNTGGILRERLNSRNKRAEGKKVAYFAGCGVKYLLPQVGNATVSLLQQEGFDVSMPGNICCGLPPYAYGHTSESRSLIRKNIDLLGQYDVIITDCGSCSSFLRKYGEMLSSDGYGYAEKGKMFSEKVVDSNEFILKHISLPGKSGGPHIKKLRVTYHDPCHLSRYQGIRREPRDLLRMIPGIELVELPESDWCCGGGGSYNTVNKEISDRILERKIKNIEATRADVVVTSCPACIIQLSRGISMTGLKIKVAHVNEVLADSMNE